MGFNKIDFRVESDKMELMFRFLLIVAAFASAGCSPSPERVASSSYVKASLKVSEAVKAFNSADYACALKLCEEAKSQVENIISKYPETAIALKIVTDPTTRIGACNYTDLSDKIIPELVLYSNPQMAGYDLPWTVALANEDAAIRDEALFELVRNIVDSAGEKGLSDAENKMRVAVVAKISSAAKKSEALAYKHSSVSAETPKSESDPLKSSQKSLEIDPSKIDIARFLTEAKTDSSLVSYDISSIGRLREKVPAALAIGGKTREMFAGYLAAAHANALKISVNNVRDTALSRMALTFADFGDSAAAIKALSDISNANPFFDTFKYVAEKVGNSKSYVSAMSLASRLQSETERDAFLAALASGVAEQGLFAESAALADKLRDTKAKNFAMAEILRISIEKKDSKGVANAASRMDFSSLEFLDQLAGDSFEKTSSDDEKKARQLVCVAEKIGTFDKSSALKFIECAVKLADNFDISKTALFSDISGKIAVCMANLGKASDALKYLNGNIYRSDIYESFKNICAVASALESKEEKLRAFAVAANICDSLKDPSNPALRACSAVSLACAVKKAGLERANEVSILAPFLPVL